MDIWDIGFTLGDNTLVPWAVRLILDINHLNGFNSIQIYAYFMKK